ncbi:MULTISPECIES: hypothetical protein [unclassified Sulfitobacter]|uniref:hypothetical protein n=1 Tax=unclassified Sulfitobacter TaxID=196795 RepID=UPI003745205E
MGVSSLTYHKKRSSVELRYLLLLGALYTIAFDFRRNEGDAGSIVVLLSVASVVFGLALVIKQSRLHRADILALSPMVIFAIIAVVSGIGMEHSTYKVIAAIFPLLNFLTASLCISAYVTSEKDVNTILRTIVICGIVAATWKVFFAFSYYGLSVSTVRYQVLSGASPMLFAFAAASFLYLRQPYVIPALVLSLGPVLLSVTRTYLLVYCAAGVVAFLAIPVQRMGRAFTGAVLGLTAVVVLGFLGATIWPEVVSRWIVRLTSNQNFGFDLTAATRLAEIDFQINKLRETTTTLLFGYGPAMETRFTGTNAILISSAIPDYVDKWTGSGYGHNAYVGVYFVGGLLGGTLLLLMLFGFLAAGFIGSKRYIGRINGPTGFCLIWGTSSLAGYLAYSTLGGTFGDRSMSFFMGLSLGLISVGIRHAQRAK